jgi:hypothetical protein
MAETGSKLKTKSEVLTEAVNKQAVKRRVQETPQDSKFEDIAANTFYKIMFDESKSPEEKKAAVVKAMTATGIKEEDQARIAEFEMFKEFLQEIREQMALEVVRLTDTEAFSELKQVYDDLNTSLLEFNDQMRPLTEIIDAIYALRTNGKTLDAFKEIQDDKKNEEELALKKKQLETDLDIVYDDIRITQNEIAELSEQKTLFGFGNIKQSAREEIAKKELEISNLQGKLENLSKQEADLQKDLEKQSSLGEFAEHKKKLRELLDITTDEHKERQTALVNAALNFVNKAKTRVGSVRDHLGKMNNQIDNLFDSNGKMINVYAILDDGLKEAGKNNQEIRNKLVPPEGVPEDTITRMTREQKKMAIEQYISSLDESTVDTLTTLSDLTTQTIRIKTMKDANSSQISKARSLYTQGIAGIADRLSVSLQAISSAALGESSAMAKETIVKMADNTNEIAQKEAIKNAMGISDVNNDIMKAIADIGSYGEVIKSATDISSNALAEMRGKMDEFKKIVDSVQGDISKNFAVNADVKESLEPKKVAPKTKTNSPFKF